VEDGPPGQDEVVLAGQVSLANVGVQVDGAVALDPDHPLRIAQVELGDESVAVVDAVVHDGFG
jgi:hypothetical protein